MKAGTIELDEDASKILDSMAIAYHGNASLAISAMLRTHETIELFLGQVEARHGAELAGQTERAERGFREGRSTSWQEVKRKNGL